MRIFKSLIFNLLFILYVFICSVSGEEAKKQSGNEENAEVELIEEEISFSVKNDNQMEEKQINPNNKKQGGNEAAASDYIIGQHEDSDFLVEFIKGMRVSDFMRMNTLIKASKERVPDEINGLLSRTNRKGMTGEEIRRILEVAESLARNYGMITGDYNYLISTKKKEFKLKLSEPVISKPIDAGKIHSVEISALFDGSLKFLAPENIVIKKGETVRWKNNDTDEHSFASEHYLGKGGINSPVIAPSKTWEFNFTEPGEYYYICMMSKNMAGKITVLDEQ